MVGSGGGVLLDKSLSADGIKWQSLVIKMRKKRAKCRRLRKAATAQRVVNLNQDKSSIKESSTCHRKEVNLPTAQRAMGADFLWDATLMQFKTAIGILQSFPFNYCESTFYSHFTAVCQNFSLA